ncbi:MAG: isochorismatase family protein [Myxococcota bacterium]|nr:isochorismatase family protein [Myxococcota bacterium]
MTENHSCEEVTFSSLIEAEGAALLVVDVQEKLWPSIHERESVGKRIVAAIEVFGRLGLPILVTEQYVKGLGTTIPQVKDALDRFGAYKPIEKFAFSCMGEPEFCDVFDDMGLQTVAIVGIESHVCVMQTTLDLLDRGVQAFYLAEATGSRDPLHKAEAVIRVRDAGAIVGSVEMLAFELLRSSKNPAFKNVQKVIL